jgi:hypothetical protein
MQIHGQYTAGTRCNRSVLHNSGKLLAMYDIDLIVKSTPVPLSIQRKSEEDAKAVFAQVQGAIESGEPKLLVLTCEGKTEKQLAIVTSELSAVQLSQKSAGAGDGKRTGFFSVIAGDE